MRRIAEREQQTDRDRLHLVRELRQRAELDRGEHTLRPDSLTHTETALERDNRFRMRLAEAVEVCAVLPAQVQQVLEPVRRDERGACALALQQCVRGHRRPVREPLDFARTDRPRRGQHRLFLPARGRHLRRP